AVALGMLYQSVAVALVCVHPLAAIRTYTFRVSVLPATGAASAGRLIAWRIALFGLKVVLLVFASVTQYTSRADTTVPFDSTSTLRSNLVPTSAVFFNPNQLSSGPAAVPCDPGFTVIVNSCGGSLVSRPP